MDPAGVQGKRFSIVGGARSGVAVARLLRHNGAEVFLSELAPLATMQETKAALDALGAESEFGQNSPRVLEADVVVLSPGVPSHAPIVRDAEGRGKTVVSEIEVASWFCPGPIIGVTGTNGKTTTVTLLGRVFEDARHDARVGGNIGTAFSDIVEGMAPSTAAILEISSFQLDYVRTFHPRVAVILNITPDHLDRYDHSFAKYVKSKCRIFEQQGGEDTLIYNEDDEATRTAVRAHVPNGVELLPFSVEHSLVQGAFVRDGRLIVSRGGTERDVISRTAISLRGTHNLANAMAATLAAAVMGVPVASLRASLKNFRGVEHRLEFVRELDGVTYVNDSKATNVDSVWYALQSFSQPIVLVLGGRDKGNDYTRLHDLVRKTVRAIVAIGESSEKVRSSFEELVPVTVCADMGEAVEEARRVARSGDVVLLSPACASFDWFQNYEHRGREFKDLVHKLR